MRLLLAACLLALASPALADEEVLTVARSYEDGGGYNRTWKGSGTPEEIRFAGEQILAKGDGTYCCGYTFTVAMRVAESRGLLAGKTADEVRLLQKRWYGVLEPSKETLCQFAVEQLGIGKEVTHAEAEPGDFVQIWRTSGSGHSVIFLKWEMEEDKRIGFHYRSSQGSTDGIRDKLEYFADADGHEGRVDRERTHFCRLNN